MISAISNLPRRALAYCLALSALLLAPFATSLAQPVFSGTQHTVTTLVDEDNGNLLPIFGAGTSLREAIIYSASGDRIVFAGGVTGTMFFPLGELSVTHDLIIIGPGSLFLELNGNDVQRIMNTAPGVLLQLERLTLSSGRAKDGAAILSQGGLWLSQILARWNTATVRGGAVFHGGGYLNIASSRFEHNDAGLVGGAVSSMSGSTIISLCEFEANSSGGGGGAVHIESNANPGLLENSSFSGNTAQGAGGALLVSVGANIQLSRSTFDGNRSASSGGGIANAGTLAILGSTISGNTADATGGGLWNNATASCDYVTIARNDAANGGGIFDGNALQLRRTLIAENTAANAFDVAGDVTSNGNNLVGVGAGSIGWIGSDRVGTTDEPMNAALDDLRMNGGATKTHALLSCSRAIDAAVAAPFIAIDQRGMLRSAHGDHDGVALPDIGAFELQAPLDNVGPVINEHPAFVVYLDSTGNATIDPDKLLISASDACGIHSTGVSKVNFTCADIDTVIVTLTATDKSFNVTTKQVKVAVVDNIDPILTIPPNKVVNANAAPNTCLTAVAIGTASATDNCSGTITITNNAPATFPVGTTTVTWTAEDASGNKTSKKQTITVNDVTDPVVVAPANKSVNAPPDKCTVLAGLVALGTPTVTDNCSFVVTNDAPAQFPLGQTIVTWTAKDASGNQGTAQQTVTVVDSTNPVVFAPADLVLAVSPNSCVRNAATFGLGAPVASDNCSVASITKDRADDFDYPIGSTIVTWTVTDGSGNQAQAVQTVTVFDADPPSIEAPDNIEVETDPGECYWTVVDSTLGTPTGATDNCTLSNNLIIERSGGPSLSVGTHRIIWTVIDAQGNRATDVQLVTVVGEPPVLSCISGVNPGDPAITDTTDAGAAGAVITYPVPTLVGNGCSDVEIIRTGGLGSGDFFPVGTTTVSYMAIDGSNQIDVCSFDVKIIDVEEPKIDVKVAPRNLWPADNGMKEIEATVEASDNVPGVTVVLTSITCNEDATGDIAAASTGQYDTFFDLRAKRSSTQPRIYTVLYTATDAVGNVSSASATVTVPLLQPKDIDGEILPAPSAIELAQNYPNPFNPSTQISFGTPTEQHVELRIYNAIGVPVRTLVSTQLAAGTYTIEWDGHDDSGNPLSSGVYLYMLRAGDAHVERKMILAR